MTRLLTEKKLLIATHNAGKLAEFQALCAPFGIEVTSSGALGLPEPEETGTTFTENALIKAHAAASASGLVALADDSGLCVEALGGDPGLYSARWAGPSRDFAFAMRKVHEALGAKLDRRAHFTAVLALAWPDGHAEVVEGRVDGVIAWPPRGTGGHGYDPVFLPEGSAQTFAEMDAAAKDAMSHRGRAFEALAQACFPKG